MDSARAPLSIAMLVGVGVCAGMFLIVPTGNVALSAFALGLTGFFIYGPHVLMTGAISMDIATRKATAYFWIACAFLSAVFLAPLCFHRPQRQRYV